MMKKTVDVFNKYNKRCHNVIERKKEKSVN